MLNLLAAVLGGAAAFFGVLWVNSVKETRLLTTLERRRLQIEAENAHREKAATSNKAKLERKLGELGWFGDLYPVIVGAGLGYMGLATGLTLAGLPTLLAILVGIPTSLAAAFAVSSVLKTRRQESFNTQLVTVLDMLATQMKSGSSPPVALRAVLPVTAEPLHSELSNALSQHRAGMPLPEAIEGIAKRYPGKAISLLAAALAIEAEQGGSLAPALEAAAQSIRYDNELSAEALAEVAEAKFQGYAIIAVIAGIAFILFNKGGGLDQLSRPVPLIGLSIGVANYLLGVFRMLRVLSKAKRLTV